MKKCIRILAALMAVVLLIGCLAGCKKKEEEQAKLENSVHEALYGAWVYFDAAQNARYTYIISYGSIEQELKLTDENGQEHDLSLGDSFSIRYKVVDEETIAIYSGMVGEDGDTDEIHFEKLDDNTLILDGVTYIRYEEWIKTHQ